jgi:hypothetical protein
MAFSQVHEIVIDSVSRLNPTTTTSSSFEYQLPFSFPTHGASQIRLTTAYIPDSFYTFPTAFSGSITAGTYTADQIVTALTGNIGSGITISWNASSQKFTFSGVPTPATSSWYIFMGWPSGTVDGSTLTSPNAASLGRDVWSRVYIRINSFENKIYLPLPASETFTAPSVRSPTTNAIYYRNRTAMITFAVPLDKKSPFGIYYLDMHTNQKLEVPSSYFNTNSLLRIELMDEFGNLVNLNGRNWQMSLRIEPVNYMDE